MAFGDNLGLAAAGAMAFLTAGQRVALGKMLVHFADAVADIRQRRDAAPAARPAADPQGPLAAARARLQRFLVGPSLQQQQLDQSAKLYAAADQMTALIEGIAALAGATGLIAEDRRGPSPGGWRTRRRCRGARPWPSGSQRACPTP